MTQSVIIKRFGGPEVFQLVDEPTASLEANSVRIRVGAAGINFADILMRMGIYPEAPKPPFVPGYEIAGTVLEVGKGVKSVRPGDHVLAGTRFGGYTSETVLPEFQIRKTPTHLTDAEAAAIPTNFLTAWIALHDMARVRKGDRVLIQSAAGGVGVAAIQMAREVGAHAVGLVSTDEKAKLIKTLGASETMSPSEWEELDDQSGGGFDVILDSYGGASLKRSLRRLAPGGRVITFGVSSMITGPKRSLSKVLSLFLNTALISPYRLMNENKGIFGLNMLRLFEKPIPGKRNLMLEAMDHVLKRFEDKSYRVVVGKTFPLTEAGKAHTYLQSRSSIGKVVLIPHS